MKVFRLFILRSVEGNKFYLYLPSMLSYLQTNRKISGFSRTGVESTCRDGRCCNAKNLQACCSLMGIWRRAPITRHCTHIFLPLRVSPALSSVLPAETDFVLGTHARARIQNHIVGDQLALDEYQNYWNDWVGSSWATAASMFRDTSIHFEQIFAVSTRKTDALDRLTPMMDAEPLNYREKLVYRMAPSSVLRSMAGISDSTFAHA